MPHLFPRWRYYKARSIFDGFTPTHALILGVAILNPWILPYISTIAGYCAQALLAIAQVTWNLRPWSFITIGSVIAGHYSWQAYHNMPYKQYTPDPIKPFVIARVENLPNALELGHEYLVQSEQRKLHPSAKNQSETEPSSVTGQSPSASESRTPSIASTHSV